MACDRWWPMKPLTPRIRTRFMDAVVCASPPFYLAAPGARSGEERGDARSIGGPAVEDGDALAVAAARVHATARHEHARMRRRARGGRVEHARAMHGEAAARQVGER